MKKNSNEYIINIIKKNQEEASVIEYIHLTILNNFKSEHDSIEINNLIQDYSNSVSYGPLCEYYDIIQGKITELIMILDSIHNTNKTFKYSLQIKYTNKKNPIRIKINNRCQKIITLSAKKIQYFK
jgi:hypothetical protein